MIELMVTIAILAVLVTLAIPSFEATINANRLTGSANELIHALQTARMEAIRRNQHAGVCFSADAETATPSCAAADADGWITFVDADASGSYDAGDTLLMTSTLPARVQLLGSPLIASAVIFHSDGRARDAGGTLLKGVVDFCIETRRPETNIHSVEIGSGSRISTGEGKGDGACAAPVDP